MRCEERGEEKATNQEQRKTKQIKCSIYDYLCALSLYVRNAPTHTHTHQRCVRNAREMGPSAIKHRPSHPCNDYDNWVCINTCLLLYERAHNSRSIYLFTLILFTLQATVVNCFVCVMFVNNTDAMRLCITIFDGKQFSPIPHQRPSLIISTNLFMRIV